MDKLSDQLSELASRTAKLEDAVTAAQDRDRQRLEVQKAELATSMSNARAKVKATATSAEDDVSTWWSSTRDSADEWFDGVRTKRAERRAAHDLEQADRVADDAEADAVDAVDFALYAIDVAEDALIDAALAREDAVALEP